MMAHVTAAALVSEIKMLAHPAAVGHDSDVGGPRRSRQHEHGRGAQGRAQSSARSRAILAIEILAGCQALDLLAPLTTSAPLAARAQAVRKIVPTLTVDRPPAPDIETIGE